MPIEKKMLNQNVEQTKGMQMKVKALGDVSNQIKEGESQLLQV
jgi:hypothetical protein